MVHFVHNRLPGNDADGNSPGFRVSGDLNASPPTPPFVDQQKSIGVIVTGIDALRAEAEQGIHQLIVSDARSEAYHLQARLRALAKNGDTYSDDLRTLSNEVSALLYADNHAG